MASPLSVRTLEEATRSFAAQPGLAEKLAWWLINPHSAEPWLQFELAFQLSRVLTGRYEVRCEKEGRKDIVLYQSQPSEPAAAIELKFFGNWWWDETSSQFLEYVTSDAQKIEKFPFDAIALAVWLFAKPREGSKYRSTFDSVRKGKGTWAIEDIRSMYTRKIRQPNVYFDISCDPSEAFETLAWHVFGFYNSRVRDGRPTA